ncbi:MAG TPA: hypothetical protein DDW42_01070 [Desulfobacteraceae bacterium]|nr:hypothetical protein [Desulfobacteraceae bacterium]
MKTTKSKIIILCIFILLIIPAGFLGYMYLSVTRDAATRIQKGAIDSIIGSESPVFYDDGRTPIGVFFEKTHRKYIHYKDIPKIFVKALIAAEDRNFFNHRGFDLKAILRAFVVNIKSGKVVQGGSTITQQTAKNVFRREKRSYKTKLKELIQAFLLERQYSKNEIIEMYTNQFFVTGYGKGLSIAAQYFFGKDPRDIGLVEAAFIAGSVKGPNRYNPFIKKNEAEKKKAIRLAKLRKDYVLSNMLKLNFITKNQYQKAKEKEIPFKEGKITYKLNVILDYVRDQLESDYFRNILQEQGINNVATSGISICTSINNEVQKSALRSLRTHLPLIDVKLNGYTLRHMSDAYQKLLQKGLKKPDNDLPFLARITDVDGDGQAGQLVVSWEKGGGIIDYEGFKPIAEAWLKWKMGNWATLTKKNADMFLKQFHVGDLIPVQVMASAKGVDEMKLMLSMIPELEGGIVVLQNGMVRGMAGGFFNRFFNRTVDAKRQMGSIFKPIVYTAALQLKWNALDSLQNTKTLFQFEDTSYFPRPDHKPKTNQVSMAWAGAKSENLATVWLLYHLTDHLNMGEFQKISNLVGLSIKMDESYLSYKKRIRDKYGVIVNKEALMEAAFEESKKDIEPDIIFGGHNEILNNLKRLHFDIDIRGLDIEGADKKLLQRFNFNRLSDLHLKMKQKFQIMAPIARQYYQNQTVELRKKLLDSLRNFYIRKTRNHQTRIIYTEGSDLQSLAALLPLIPERMVETRMDLKIKAIWLDDLITSGVMDLIQDNIKKNYRRLFSHKRYDPKVLYRIRDFRTLVNLYYVIYLAKAMGISTKLDPVLSFPLGANSISIIETALAYQTIMTGKSYGFSHEQKSTLVPIITKIIGRDGEVLWEYKPESEQVLSNRVSEVVTEILKKVMQIGTGRRAKNAIRVSDIPIPSFGKTGTANRFTNSSFVGFIPYPNEKTGQFDMQDGYVIASYMGYDNNRPMKSEHMTVYGSSGALPLWIDTANAIVNTYDYMKKIGPHLADIAFNEPLSPLTGQEEFKMVPVSPITGLPLDLSKEKLGAKKYFEPLKGKIE